MGAVPDKYVLVKEDNNNVTLQGYLNSILIEQYSLHPAKDIRISQSYPESIVIPVDSIGNHVDNKFVCIPWDRIAFNESFPPSNPTNIIDAVIQLGEDFFYELGAVGPVGPTGPQGPIGPQGVPGPVGPAGLNWQGAWSASGTYVIDDAVGYNGASWFCIAPVGPSATPPDVDTTNWALLAAQGATGPQGPQGIQGPAGPSGAGCLTGTNYIIVCADGTPVQNATKLQQAYTTALSMSPSATNRVTIVAKPGYYDFGSTTFVINTDYISLVSLTGNKDVIFNSTNPLGTIDVSADNLMVKGVDVQSKQFIVRNVNYVTIENCSGGDHSFGWDDTMGSNSKFINCQGEIESFSGGPNGVADGEYINCKGGYRSFGGGGVAIGSYTDCVGADDSFGTNGVANGKFVRCTGGDNSFAGSFAAIGEFIDCNGGFSSFGGNGIASGTFTRCKGKVQSFGGYLGYASGSFVDCIGTNNSFGGDGGYATGSFSNCVGGDKSFGKLGVLSGKLYYCRLTSGTFETVSGGGRTIYCIDGNNNTNNQ